MKRWMRPKKKKDKKKKGKNGGDKNIAKEKRI